MTKIFSFFFVIFLFTFYILHFPVPVHAQDSTGSTSLTTSPSAIPIPTTVSPTSPIYTDLLVHNLFHSFSCLSIGSSVIGQPCLTYQLTRDAQGAIQGVPVLSSANLSGGLLGAATGLIAGLYANPPLRTGDYLASVGEGLGIVKPAHAQVVGSGAQVLSPILSLWQVSRNISYVIMIIIFVIIGFMVMFRNRINPQTVITAQAALPGLVIGLILITFSYFLAALISDMAFVGTNLVGYYFSIAQNNDPQNLVETIKERNVLGIFTPFTKIISRGEVDGAISSIWDDLADPNTNRLDPTALDPQKVLVILTGFIFYQLLSPFTGLFGGVSQIIGGLIAVTGAAVASVQLASFALSFIAILVLIYAMFRLLLRLISAFLTIIFLTISAPFQFLAAALPGRQGIATAWILNMLANILVFPAVLAVLYFVAYLLGPNNPTNQNCRPTPCTFIISQSSQAPDNIFATPVYAQGGRIVGEQSFPLFGGLNLGLIELLLAFGALVALPKIPDIVVSAVGRMGQAGQLIGQELGGSIAQGRGYAGQIQQGAGGIGQQVGRLITEHGYQYIPDPTQPEGYRIIPTATAGQFGRFRRGFARFRTRLGI